MVTGANSRGITLLFLGLSCSRGETPGPRAGSEPVRSASASGGAPSEERNLGRRTPASTASFDWQAKTNAVAGGPGLPVQAPALSLVEPFLSLEVPGFRPAVVSLPTGATRPKPVAVALHGNFDRPEWQCEVWRGVVGTRGFILCPRGIPRRDVAIGADRWEYGPLKGVEAEIEAGLSALRERFGELVDKGPVLFIGFSLGAILGSPLVQKQPARFPRVVLIEGGQARWTSPNAAAFVKAGGQRLFIACGQAGCLAQARNLSRKLEKAGLAVRFGGSSKAGHTYDGQVAAAVAEAFPWLVSGDARWEGP